MIYCDDVLPPAPPTPPSPSLPPGDQYVAPRTYKNESCPVVLPTLRFGEAVASTVSGSEGKLEYRHPGYYPGYTDNRAGLAERYLAVSDMAPPYNRSYINPVYEGCSESNGYQCTQTGNFKYQYISGSCSLLDCRPTQADALIALAVLEATYHEGYSFECEYMGRCLHPPPM